ncbi:glycoside hydrolase family 2 protein [Uliginosibacterium sp. sgz301328]|uniref:glycoside hydrolase family 2 protein n=1 Tax=Uliginosibacterium sp. sgz301328 TaxID=3243764 RepID=UPI00359E9F3C
MLHTSAVDPFAHLHDESYASRYEAPVLGADGLIFVEGRSTLALDGEWRCTLDPFDEGLRQRWFADEPTPPAQWDAPRDYDSEGGRRVAVPGCVNLYDPTWLHYEGAVWFSREFDFVAQAGERVFMRIGAAAYQCRVFLNGVFLGVHLGGSTPFCVELRGVRNGRNRLQIQVDNSRQAGRVPMHHIDWFNYGGIYREVSLVKVPHVFIADFGATLAASPGHNRLRFDMTVSDAADGVGVVEIPALGLRAEIEVRGGVGRIEVDAVPVLWSPENPHLYTVHARFGQDSVSDRVGFRDIRVDAEHILLNGQPIWLRGICVHEEHRDMGKRSSEGTERAMLEDARALGCNFLRLSHYPHHERVARLADELGFLLWEEIPVYWAIDFASPATFRDAENQLRELIRRDRNRASVIVWGIGNENEDSDARYAFMSRLAAVARQADGSRLVSAACLINREKFMIEDRLAAHLDIVGINEYFGWYEPDFEGLSTLLGNSRPGKPVVITETGAEAVAGLRGGRRDLFSEDCQADIYREQIERIGKAPYVKGLCPWILYDFRSERRQTGYQSGYNRKGLIAEDRRTRKAAFDVLAAFYRDRAGVSHEGRGLTPP